MNKKVGCSLAWHGVCVNQDGTLDPCCQYTNPFLYKRLPFDQFEEFDRTVRQRMRDDFAEGKAHDGCQKCYQEESAGWTTLRNFANQWYPDTDTTQIQHVELRLGNYCNLKCFMCSPGSSSSIAVERQQHAEKFATAGIYPYVPDMPHYWATEEFADFSQAFLSQIQRINITGGEPFMIPEVVAMLDRLVQVKDTIVLSFNTNMTLLSDRLLERLKQFRNLEICVSLEGVGAHNDYLRYPSQWYKIESNIQKLKQQVPQAHVSVNHTFQHASVYSLPDLAAFCKHNQISLHMTLVQGDAYLGLESVPPRDLARLIKWADDTDQLNQEQRQFVMNIAQSTHFDLELYLKLRDYVTVLDSIRKTSWDQTFTPSFEQLKLFD
jgi:sulfatase maturation enzyme AslB (radical SAM superfamily)